MLSTIFVIGMLGSIVFVCFCIGMVFLVDKLNLNLTPITEWINSIIEKFFTKTEK